ncbi:hypothetical protein AVEN_51785-1 [Araneus ventricosus]|uniref:Uncharacterized protein n=1 Tax=Araneus ventricosus TaxID=182803 RepID=A0A4Y2M465_ARAVE|nr:hypothetical protein AVEN_51785-1 [Araneus ventricosus]
MCLQAELDPETHAKVRNLIMLDGSPALMTVYTRKHKLYFMSDSDVEDEAQALFSYVMQFLDIDLMEVCDGKITVHIVEGARSNFILGKGEKDVSNLISDIFSY